DIAYLRAADDLACEVPRPPVFERGDVLYDVTQRVLALSPTARDLNVLERVRSQDRNLADG
ncbi:MAG: ribonuclease H-like domain-containing protein, partial [Myxococcaceae bacterium]